MFVDRENLTTEVQRTDILTTAKSNNINGAASMACPCSCRWANNTRCAFYVHCV